VAKAGQKLDIMHQQKLGDLIHVSPAFDANTIYIRSAKQLWAFRKD